MRARSASAASGRIVRTNSSIRRIARSRCASAITPSAKPFGTRKLSSRPGPGDDVLERPFGDYRGGALRLGKAADQLAAEILLGAEHPQPGMIAVLDRRRIGAEK